MPNTLLSAVLGVESTRTNRNPGPQGIRDLGEWANSRLRKPISIVEIMWGMPRKLKGQGEESLLCPSQRSLPGEGDVVMSGLSLGG